MRSISYDIEFDLDSFLIDLRARAAGHRNRQSARDIAARSSRRAHRDAANALPREPAPQR